MAGSEEVRRPSEETVRPAWSQCLRECKILISQAREMTYTDLARRVVLLEEIRVGHDDGVFRVSVRSDSIICFLGNPQRWNLCSCLIAWDLGASRDDLVLIRDFETKIMGRESIEDVWHDADFEKWI